MNMDAPNSYIINETVWLMSKHADRMLRESFGISYSWFLCLAALSAVQPATQHALAQALNYSDAAVSRLVQKLLDTKLVTVTPSAHHAGKNTVGLSTQGQDLLGQATLLLEKEFNRALKDAEVDITALIAAHHALNKILRSTL